MASVARSVPARSFDVIAFGASAGGIEALKVILASLPGDFAAAILVTLHIAAHGLGVLPRVLGKASSLPVEHARDGEPLRRGEVLVAPPDHHLLLRGNRVHLSLASRENGQRPAIDPMFRSVARTFGSRAVGVVLSGYLDDGTLGLAVIKARSGVTVAQDPFSATVPDMPRNAIAAGVVDHIVPLADIGGFLMELVSFEPQRTDRQLPKETETEIRMTESDPDVIEHDQQPGTPSNFTCPDCGGVLRSVEDGVQPTHFRCQVGHAWGEESLRAAKEEQLEAALWTALRSLAESAKLFRHLAAHSSGNPQREQRYRERASEIDEHVRVLRDALLASNDERDGAPTAA